MMPIVQMVAAEGVPVVDIASSDDCVRAFVPEPVVDLFGNHHATLRIVA